MQSNKWIYSNQFNLDAVIQNSWFASYTKDLSDILYGLNQSNLNLIWAGFLFLFRMILKVSLYSELSTKTVGNFAGFSY